LGAEADLVAPAGSAVRLAYPHLDREQLGLQFLRIELPRHALEQLGLRPVAAASCPLSRSIRLSSGDINAVVSEGGFQRAIDRAATTQLSARWEGMCGNPTRRYLSPIDFECEAGAA
jgi:hypothetical protein